MNAIINFEDAKQNLLRNQELSGDGLLDMPNDIRWKTIISNKVTELSRMNGWGLDISERDGALAVNIVVDIPGSITCLCGILSVAESARISMAGEEHKAVISITYNPDML